MNSVYEVKKVSLLPSLLRDFIVCVRFCLKSLSASIDMVMWFFLFSLLM